VGVRKGVALTRGGANLGKGIHLCYDGGVGPEKERVLITKKMPGRTFQGVMKIRRDRSLEALEGKKILERRRET